MIADLIPALFSGDQPSSISPDKLKCANIWTGIAKPPGRVRRHELPREAIEQRGPCPWNPFRREEWVAGRHIVPGTHRSKLFRADEVIAHRTAEVDMPALCDFLHVLEAATGDTHAPR